MGLVVLVCLVCCCGLVGKLQSFLHARPLRRVGGFRCLAGYLGFLLGCLGVLGESAWLLLVPWEG